MEDWPRLNDSLLRSTDPDWRLNACFDSWCGDIRKWVRYVEGYRKAADAAVAAVVEDHWERDLMIYPIIFLYRHHFELALKTIGFVGAELLQDPWTMPTQHYLRPLWAQAEKVLLTRWDRTDRAPVDLTKAVIYELDTIDPNSFYFRYPEGKDGKPIPPPAQILHIRNFGEVAGRASNFLTSCLDGLTCELDEAHQWRNELRDHWY